MLTLLHGALSSGSQMTALADALGGAGTPDLPGHGANPAEPYDLARFVDTVDGDDVVGYSLGGYVALAAAIAKPDRVRRVVTIATKLDWIPELGAAEAGRLDADRLAEKAPAFVADLAERHPGPGWRTVLAETAAFLRGLGEGPPLDLAKVTCPALVLVGEADAMVTRDECERAVATMPDARLEVLPGTPHQYERMDVADLAARIRAFLD